jgi:hypothetical protein
MASRAGTKNPPRKAGHRLNSRRLPCSLTLAAYAAACVNCTWWAVDSVIEADAWGEDAHDLLSIMPASFSIRDGANLGSANF